VTTVNVTAPFLLLSVVVVLYPTIFILAASLISN